jgi:hypothetical protein
MLTHRGLTIPPHLDEQVFSTHEALDMLAIKRPPAPTQFRRDPARTITRMLDSDCFDCFA